MTLTRLAILASAATIAFVGSAHAKEVKVSGTETYTSTAEQTKLSDGSMMIRIRQKGIIVDNNASSPLHMNSQDCEGMVILAADGKSSGSGNCDAVDKDGDRWWLWWVTRSDNDFWGVTYGTGKFADMTGGGTTKMILQFNFPPDRGAFSYEGTLNMK